MSLSGNLKTVANNVQEVTKQKTISLAQILLRLVSGFFLGLVVGLVVQELTKGSELVFAFTGLVVMAAVYKSLSRLHIFQILIFDLICVLVAALLKMYIVMAP